MSSSGSREDMPFMQHWVAQLFDVDRELLDSEQRCREKLVRVTAHLGLRIFADFAHKFDLGVSAFVVIAESHVALHTWPEFGYAHVDVITCSHTTDFNAFREELLAEFSPRKIEVTPIRYGVQS